MSYKTKRATQSSIEKLNKELDKLQKKNNGGKDDDRFWRLERDKADNGFAIIRFLDTPEQDGEDGLPWVRIFDHGFQGPNGWYIEKSLTTINQQDPVSKYNSKLYNSGNKSSIEQAKKQKRRLKYISNILVVSDPKNPENEGKVFLFRYGKKIFDKITAAMNPQFEDEKPFNPFHLVKGANFKLKVRKHEGYINYDLSAFESPTPIASTDDEVEAIWKKEYSLKEFLDPKHFKSYAELEKRFNEIMGFETLPERTPLPKAEVPDQEDVKQPIPSVSDEDDETDPDLDYFKRLAEE